MYKRWVKSSENIAVEEKKEEFQKKKIWIYEDFSEEKMIYITLRVMMAIQYLHSKNVVFMDLKPQNILIFRDWQVKLGDFGGAIRIRDDLLEYNVHCYTAKFASKEFVEKVKKPKQKFSKKELMDHEFYSLWKTFSYFEE